MGTALKPLTVGGRGPIFIHRHGTLSASNTVHIVVYRHGTLDASDTPDSSLDASRSTSVTDDDLDAFALLGWRVFWAGTRQRIQ